MPNYFLKKCNVFDTVKRIITDTIKLSLFFMIDGHILIVDDNDSILESARMFLKEEFSDIILENDPRQIISHLNSGQVDVILLDMNFKPGVNDGSEGFYWLEIIKDVNPDIVVIMITAYGEVDLAVEAMKRGASDFVLKPWKNQKLLGTIMSGLQLKKSKQEVNKLKQEQKSLISTIKGKKPNILGESKELKEVLSVVNRVADTDANILILGENGTGKELIAREIHHQSGRASEPFITVDMGAITESLFESELFGHVKGSFTDAIADKVGSFELAGSGTIFLDEIGNLSLPLQAKILSVLQNQLVIPVGSNTQVPMRARVISATNRPVAEMVANGEFRQDLLFRINTIEITVPALRERSSDILLLFDYFNEYYSKQYGKAPLELAAKQRSLLIEYGWPGNVRELQHAVERAVILSEDSRNPDITVLIGQTSNASANPIEAETLEEMERLFLLNKLAENNGNVTKTARVLGMTRTALYRRINKYRLY